MTAEPNHPLREIRPQPLGTGTPPSEENANSAGQPSELMNYNGFELWLRRFSVLMFVFVCATVGVFLVILPWRPEWTDNHLLTAYPALRDIVGSGFVRGVCTGLGVLDIWIGFWEAVHYHEEHTPK